MQDQVAGRCSYCSGQTFTPLTMLRAERHTHLDYQPVGGGMFSSTIVRTYGTVCLECGHVMFFVHPEALDKLRKMGRLEAAVPFDTP